MARGVSTGNSSSRNTDSSTLRSWGVTAAGSTTCTFSLAISWRRVFQMRCWAFISSAAAALTRVSCSDGVRPSWLTLRTPSRTWPFSPAMRTM